MTAAAGEVNKATVVTIIAPIVWPTIGIKPHMNTTSINASG